MMATRAPRKYARKIRIFFHLCVIFDVFGEGVSALPFHPLTFLLMFKCVVKITISAEGYYNHIGEVIYFRSGMSPDFVERWLWFFEYLAALVKVANPRRKVEFYKGPQDCLLGKEWHEYRRAALLKSRATKLKQLEKGVVDDDLFHFKSQDYEAKKLQIIAQIDALNRDELTFEEFPYYINEIKRFI